VAGNRRIISVCHPALDYRSCLLSSSVLSERSATRTLGLLLRIEFGYDVASRDKSRPTAIVVETFFLHLINELEPFIHSVAILVNLTNGKKPENFAVSVRLLIAFYSSNY